MFEPDASLLRFNGTRFTSIEQDGEFWIRADELGLAIGLEPPEEAVLDLYRNNLDQFSERLTAMAGVETSEGPRLMRTFNLLGAYVLCSFLDTPGSRTVRRWLLETIIYFQIDVKREIRRLIEEHKMMLEMIETLRADVDALKAAAREREPKDDAGGKPDWFEGEFRRLFEENMQTFREALSAILMECLASLPAGAENRQGMEHLAEAIAGLYERIDGAVPSWRLPIPQATGNIPALAAPSEHWMRFRYEDSQVSVLLNNGSGPWFLLKEFAGILGIHVRYLKERLEFLGDEHYYEMPDEDGGILVDETGLCFALKPDQEHSDAAGRLWAWLRNVLIPAVETLILREDEALRAEDDPDWHRPSRLPAEKVADGLFPVYAGNLDGRECRLVNSRHLHKFLEIRRPFVEWIPDQLKYFGWGRNLSYLRVLVRSRSYDYYLDLDAALDLLYSIRSPKAGEAYGYLLGIASQGGRVIEGEAVKEERADAGSGLVSVPFHTHSLPSFQRDGEIYVAMKPIVEAMGLDWRSQYLRIKRNTILSEGMVIMTIPSEGGQQETVALPLKLLNGWLFGIDVDRVKLELRETILTYQRESYDVLYRYWHGMEQSQHGGIKLSLAEADDTPPSSPLAFEYEGRRLRVAILGGLPWFYASDLFAATNTRCSTPDREFADVPFQWRGLLPGVAGESSIPALSVPGVAYYFGRNPKDFGDPLFNYIVGEVLPSIQEKLGAAPTASLIAPALPEIALAPLPAKKHYTSADALYGVLTDLLRRRQERDGQPIEAAIPNSARLLAWLWRNAPSDGEWLYLRQKGVDKSQIAVVTGVNRRSLDRAMERLDHLGFIKRSATGLDESVPFWPIKVLLLRQNILAALGEHGLSLPGGKKRKKES